MTTFFCSQNDGNNWTLKRPFRTLISSQGYHAIKCALLVGRCGSCPHFNFSFTFHPSFSFSFSSTYFYFLWLSFFLPFFCFLSLSLSRTLFFIFYFFLWAILLETSRQLIKSEPSNMRFTEKIAFLLIMSLDVFVDRRRKKWNGWILIFRPRRGWDCLCKFNINVIFICQRQILTFERENYSSNINFDV